MLGEGTFSKVIEEEGLAVKIFKNKYSSAAVREIAILKYMDHPNIINPLSIKCEYNGVTKIYMKKYSRDLAHAQWLGNENAGEFMFRCIYHLASALAYIHEIFVIHCDVKPENVLIDDETGNNVLCDFNISIYNPKVVDYKPTNIQTPSYRAPEINIDRNVGKFNAKVDIWSLGCVMFEILTGNLLVPNPSDDSTINACAIFDIGDFFTREKRRFVLDKINHSICLKFLQNKLSAYWPKFKKYIDIMAGCLIPNIAARWSAAKIISRLSDLYTGAVIHSAPIIPLSTLDFADQIIAETLQEISTGNVRADEYLFTGLPVSMKRAARLLEINYYQAINRNKICNTIEAQNITRATIYIICCITGYYTELQHSNEKCADIMKTLDFNLIA